MSITAAWMSSRRVVGASGSDQRSRSASPEWQTHVIAPWRDAAARAPRGPSAQSALMAAPETPPASSAGGA